MRTGRVAFCVGICKMKRWWSFEGKTGKLWVLSCFEMYSEQKCKRRSVPTSPCCPPQPSQLLQESLLDLETNNFEMSVCWRSNLLIAFLLEGGVREKRPSQPKTTKMNFEVWIWCKLLDKLVCVFISASPLEDIDLLLQVVIFMFLYMGKHKSKRCYCSICLNKRL